MIRYLILLITTLCITFILANMILFHFTVICMTPGEGTCSSNATTAYTRIEESWIFSSLSVGRIVGALPTVFMINRFGLRITFTTFGIINGISTIFLPFVSNMFYMVLLIRLLEGMGSACLFVAPASVALAWGGTTEQALFVSILSCSYEVAPMLANGVSGFLCTSPFGWPAVYYLFGTFTTVIFVAYALVYSNRPEKNRFTSASPSTQVYDVTQSKPQPKKKEPAPYMAILKSPSAWGVWMTALGDAVAYQMFAMYAPTYINKVLHFDITQTGIFSALPFLLAIGVKFFGGIFLDRITCISEHHKVLGFTAISQTAMTACFFILTFLDDSNQVLAQVVFTMSIIFSGLHVIGYFRTSQAVGQQFSHILTSVFAVENALTALLLPVLVAFFAPNHSSEEARHRSWLSSYPSFSVGNNLLLHGRRATVLSRRSLGLYDLSDRPGPFSQYPVKRGHVTALDRSCAFPGPTSKCCGHKFEDLLQFLQTTPTHVINSSSTHHAHVKSSQKTQFYNGDQSPLIPIVPLHSRGRPISLTTVLCCSCTVLLYYSCITIVMPSRRIAINVRNPQGSQITQVATSLSPFLPYLVPMRTLA
uniref:MFS domain-containing protein n=1 Tax=Steinernema glaseri TaxID=37863 RepID=A0A1I8AH49_9BILA